MSRQSQNLAVRTSRLHDHMLHEHGRSGGDISGLPLADLHHFEHVEQAMGLIDLNHQHHEDLETHEPSRAWSVLA